MNKRIGVRRGAAAMVAAALLVVPVTVPSAASAATPDDWWWETYGIQELHDAGATGAGVKIAVADDLINPDLPAFAGRELKVADGTICQETSSPTSAEPSSGSVHGSTVTAMIIGTGEGAGGVRGIAPDAEVTFYGWGRTDVAECTSRDYPDRLSPFASALQRALDDGADIFTTSLGSSDPTPDDALVIANAIAAGMVIVHTTTNPGATGPFGEYSGENTNGVVYASAVDRAGDLPKSDDGQPYVQESTRVVAAGVDMPTVGREGMSWDDSFVTSGSSFAAPLVAGMIALAAQRHPDATGNQLVQSLIHTTNATTTAEPVSDPGSGYGYGAAWPATLLADDPTDYPDENPLMDRPSGRPTMEDVAAAKARGSVYPPEAAEEASPAPSGETPSSAAPVGVILAVVLGVLGVVVVAGVVTVLIVVIRKKNTHRGGTP